ncbi:MAG: caspase family protein [Phycisphaerales bacterium]
MRPLPRLQTRLQTGLLTVAMAGASAPAVGAPGQADDRDIIGLYIGIGAYHDATVPELSLHRTNAELLVPLLAERFGIEWLPPLLDDDASRTGIRDGMLSLLERAREARDTGRDVTVLLMYTGHGSRVLDQNGDEPDGYDETWVTIGSSLEEGADDVRDDDIAAFRLEVERIGAELVMIIDSCHSETVFRGENALSVHRPRPGPGPSEPLFPDLPEAPIEQHTGDGFFESPTSARFVALAAAQDDEPALQVVDASGRVWGRFSRVLAESLEQLGPGATYRDLHEAIHRRFDARYADVPQRPTLHPLTARRGHADTLLFGGGFPIPHATVEITGDGSAALSRGRASGYEPGAIVSVFRSYESLAAGDPPVTRAPITRADLVSSEIELSANDLDRPVARLAVPAVPPMSVYLSPRLPDAIRDRVRADQPVSVAFSDTPDESGLTWTVLEDGRIAMTPGIVEDPDAAGREDARLRTIAVIDDADSAAAAAAMINDVIDSFVRARRFWSLAGDESAIEVGFEVNDRPGIAAASGADLEVVPGDIVRLVMTNRSREGRYVTFAYATGTANGLGEFHAAPSSFWLEPGESERIEFEAHDPPSPGEPSVTRIKVLSSLEPMSLGPALDPPSREDRRRVRAMPDAFASLIEGTITGQRAGPRAEAARWSATNRIVRTVHGPPAGG